MTHTSFFGIDGKIRVGGYHEELLPAIPRHDLPSGTQGLVLSIDGSGDCPEAFIPLNMTIGIVVALEIVDIHHQDMCGAAHFPAGLPELFRLFAQPPAGYRVR